MAAPPMSVTVTGERQVARRLASVSDGLARGNMIDTALTASALVAMNAAKRNAPFITSNLKRSIHVERTGAGLEQPTTGTKIGAPAGRHVVAVGTNVVYARRVEYGFAGTDRLGRTYHQPAQPYVRPALDENVGAMRREFAAALGDLLRAALR